MVECGLDNQNILYSSIITIIIITNNKKKFKKCSQNGEFSMVDMNKNQKIITTFFLKFIFPTWGVHVCVCVCKTEGFMYHGATQKSDDNL